MTNTEKLLIAQQLKQGLGYTDIAKKLGMSVNTVKSYCQRNGLHRNRTAAASVKAETVCRQCGGALIHTPGRKKEAVLFRRLPDALVACSPGARQKCQSCAMPDVRQGVRDGPCAEVLQSSMLHQRTVWRLYQFKCRQRVLEYADQLTVDF